MTSAARRALAVGLLAAGCEGASCRAKQAAPDESAPLPSVELRERPEAPSRAAEPVLRGAAGEELGSAVALGEDLACRGPSCPGDVVVAATKAGRVVIAERAAGSWSAGTSPPLGALDARGASLATLGPAVLVGAPADADGRGAAVALERRAGAWAVAGRLEAPEPRAGERCGGAIAARAGLVAIACERRLLVFQPGEGGAWARVGELAAPPGSRFVAVDVDRDLVAARAEAEPKGAGARPGEIVVWARKGAAWAEARRAPAEAGEGLALAGPLVAWQARGAGASRAAFFALEGAAPDPLEGGKLFGERLAMDAGALLVGEKTSRGAGRVHLVTRSGGLSRSAVLAPTDGRPHDWFGAALALGSRWIAIGAPKAKDRAGALYVAAREP